MVVGGVYDYFSAILACTGSVLFLGLKQDPATEAQAWPVDVYNVNGNNLSTVTNKADYITEWNADADNQAVGILRGTYGPFGFEIVLNCDVNVAVLSDYFVIPVQTIGSAILQTANGGSVVVSGLTKIADFAVGPGKPMEDGDNTFNSSFLINKKFIAIVSGFIPPIDTTGTGAGMDASALYVSKALAGDTILFNGGLAAGQTVQIYAYT